MLNISWGASHDTISKFCWKNIIVEKGLGHTHIANCKTSFHKPFSIVLHLIDQNVFFGWDLQKIELSN